ncbi:hypothetical protein F0562_030413 [Nyssa sinensis]|uniref:Uncharacterized protein n=1 Tax=Nyssa sinensis TaxID=561372 RepID=A0A5J5AYR4_9ASTE|nr:hypothetical protein F0562_030413 [Nyssa sinensis]
MSILRWGHKKVLDHLKKWTAQLRQRVHCLLRAVVSSLLPSIVYRGPFVVFVTDQYKQVSSSVFVLYVIANFRFWLCICPYCYSLRRATE